MPESYTGYDPVKLVQRVVDMDHLASQAADAFQGASTVFCALGTTRPVAGSAEAFQKVDLEYVKEAAQAAKAAGVPHFSLISAQGANPKTWSSTLKILHPFLYMKTKGLVGLRGGCWGRVLGQGQADRSGASCSASQKRCRPGPPLMIVGLSQHLNRGVPGAMLSFLIDCWCLPGLDRRSAERGGDLMLDTVAHCAG